MIVTGNILLAVCIIFFVLWGWIFKDPTMFFNAGMLVAAFAVNSFVGWLDKVIPLKIIRKTTSILVLWFTHPPFGLWLAESKPGFGFWIAFGLAMFFIAVRPESLPDALFAIKCGGTFFWLWRIVIRKL
jgi:hypothetical protein